MLPKDDPLHEILELRVAVAFLARKDKMARGKRSFFSQPDNGFSNLFIRGLFSLLVLTRLAKQRRISTTIVSAKAVSFFVSASPVFGVTPPRTFA